MAKLISIVMVIFALTPALAPLFGEQNMFAFGWRGIFLVFVIFGVILLSWFFIRLGETLPIKKTSCLSAKTDSFVIGRNVPEQTGEIGDLQTVAVLCDALRQHYPDPAYF